MSRSPERSGQKRLVLEDRLKAWWIAPAIFGLFTLIYFTGFIFSNEVMEGLDTRMEYYRGKESAAEKIADLAPENWDRYLGGTPISGFRQPKYFPLYPIYVFTTFHRYLGWRYFFATFFAGLFTYHCARGMRLRRSTSILAGFGYASSPTLLTFIYPGQEGKMLAMAALPLMVCALDRIIDTRKPLHTFVLGAGVAAGIYTPHLQMLYYALIGLGIYFVVRLVQTYLEERDVRAATVRTALAAGGIVLGLAVGATGTFPAYEYTKTESRRAGDKGQGVSLEYAQSWSLHPEEIASLLIPEFVHFFKPQERQNLYWGRNALKLNAEYFGIAIVFFAAMAIARARTDKRVLPHLLVAAIAMAFALGSHTPVFLFFYHFVPGMNVLRTPGMIAFLFAFPAVLLAATAINRLLDNQTDVDGSRIRLFGGISCVLFLIVAVTPDTILSLWNSLFWSDIPGDKLQVAKQNLHSLSTGAWLGSLWLAALTGLTILRIRKRIPAQTFLLLLLPILLIDTWRINKQFLKYVNPDRFPDPDVYIPQTLGIIESDTDYHRTWIPAGDVQLPESVDLVTVDYHEPFILRRYDRATKHLMQLLQSGQRNETYQLLNILNVKYLAIAAQKVQGLLPALVSPEQTGEEVTLRPGIEAVATERNVYLFRNRNALPFFYLATDAIRVGDEDQALQALTSARLDPTRQVILEQEAPLQLAGVQPTGRVVVDAFNERQGIVRLNVRSDQNSLLVVSQNFHPYWSAAVDGQPVEILRANYVWQAVPLPAGNHSVTLTYQDSLAVVCRWISLISTILLIAGLVFFTRGNRDSRT